MMIMTRLRIMLVAWRARLRIVLLPMSILHVLKFRDKAMWAGLLAKLMMETILTSVILRIKAQSRVKERWGAWSDIRRRLFSRVLLMSRFMHIRKV